MNPQFQTGYRTNLYFYIAMGLTAIVMNLSFHRIPTPFMIGFAVVFIGSVIAFIKAAKKPDINCTAYGKFQSVAFTVVNMVLSMTFDSAQVFIYAMCFSTILIFVFIDTRVSKFHLFQSLIIVIIAAGIISVYTGSMQTMFAYSFGTVLLLVANWVILSMTTHINFQYRKSTEQERSLDDMLKVVEAKCYEAQEATRTKSRFLAQMSHEIRTPINAVIGMNEMILRESSDKEILKYASEAKTAADSLLGIINDILDITRIESGKLTPILVEYDLEKFIADIYNMIQFKAVNKDLDFKVIVDETLPSRLRGDDVRLRQIVINLLSNAVKYTHKGSITLEIKNIDTGWITFSVKDTGIGIREEDIARLFNAFDRVDEKINRSIEGSGLGLNITSSLLKMFGSELKVSSKYGEGSEFSFVIYQEIIDETPVGKIDLTNVKYEHKQYKVSFSAPEAKVLVVDDNGINRRVFKNLLKKTGIEVSEAGSGMECLEMVRENAYDLIFMDHMMPIMDGVETFKELRKMEDNLSKDAPVIILTANAVVGAEEYYLSEGFDGFLSKPVNSKKLEEIICSKLPSGLLDETTEKADTAEEKPQTELPIVNGIDWSYARLHFEDDGSMLETIAMFRKSVVKDTEEIDGYFHEIDEEDGLNSYRIKVHGMKSTAALIGIVRLAGMALELEEAARSGSTDIIRAIHPVFVRRWQEYYSELAVLFEDDKPLKDAAEHRDELLEIFEKIRNAAKVMDVDTLDGLSKQLDEYSFDEKHSAVVEEVKKSIFNFETGKLKNCSYD